MKAFQANSGPASIRGRVDFISRADLEHCRCWADSFAFERKDRRYYELIEDTISQGFEYTYLAVKNEKGEICAIQPSFIVDQDLLAGLNRKLGCLVNLIRRAWPRFMKMRILMVGCVAGEGQLDNFIGVRDWKPALLAKEIVSLGRNVGVSLIVLKEFPAKYRDALNCFLHHGFERIPSMPMTKLNIAYGSFDEYMNKALNSATRTKLRRKFRAAAQASPIELTVLDDVSPYIDSIYPLYLRVYERSKLHFEKLTKEYFCGLGGVMPDKVRFFIWRMSGKIVAFTVCMLEHDAVCAEYIGLDYSVALDLHLYHYAVRDMISWSIANGYEWFRSSGLNYDPKLHLRHRLDPVDLYVRHVSHPKNIVLKYALPFIEPTRYDKTLRKFPNYTELWNKS